MLACSAVAGSLAYLFAPRASHENGTTDQQSLIAALEAESRTSRAAAHWGLDQQQPHADSTSSSSSSKTPGQQ